MSAPAGELPRLARRRARWCGPRMASCKDTKDVRSSAFSCACIYKDGLAGLSFRVAWPPKGKRAKRQVLDVSFPSDSGFRPAGPRYLSRHSCIRNPSSVGARCCPSVSSVATSLTNSPPPSQRPVYLATAPSGSNAHAQHTAPGSEALQLNTRRAVLPFEIKCSIRMLFSLRSRSLFCPRSASGACLP
jgi:hypothetical protein